MMPLLVFVPPLTLLIAATVGGPALALPPLVLFGMVPLLDQILPQNTDNSPGPAWQRWLPIGFVPVQLVVLGVALAQVAFGGWSPLEQFFLALCMGFTSAATINVAHELMHRPGKLEQRLAELLMASTSYTHFCIEHVQGHHKNVGTPKDPATSRLGESLYAYLPRTLVGGLRSAWAIEAARSGIGGKNRMLHYGVFQVALLAGLYLSLGVAGLAAFLFQSAVAILMLETINYLEHYGLERKELAPGRYERVQPQHSWNSSHVVSNGMLLNLARHSDHHAFAARSFRELRHYEDVPQLPSGYSAMLMLATVPPLWFRVMNPRVIAAKQAQQVEVAATA
ncbi:MAG TPA: alkane 1-monooxygenase [Myxococcota bacterium]|nr:alkane 1-monooxygenase [Myxococcota bacterium]